MQKIIVAIDGYSACGKSSTAKRVAGSLGYIYIDSGAMYRAVTLFFIENHVTITNLKEVEEAFKNIRIEFKRHNNGKTYTYLNGLNVESGIRTMNISSKVSDVSAIPEVRRALVRQQQKMGNKKGIVMDGRDIGTVVFPDAELKLFMNADLRIRGERRQKELLEKGQMLDLDKVLENLKYRDHIDSTRAEGPLRMAKDAEVMDTTHLTLDEQVEMVLEMALTRILNKSEKPS